MPTLELILSVVILIIGFRTLCWHLQCWQLREYRLDRMKAWLNTKDGKSYFLPWFFKGLLPRPKFSFRVALMALLTLTISVILYLAFSAFLLLTFVSCALVTLPPETTCAIPLFIGLLALLLTERTLWLQIALAVLISNIPVKLKKLHLFLKAGQVVKQGDQNIIRIGITGSYGKSSTKELLVHLLMAEFGSENVLFNPANNNTEVAIARLILNNKKFFNPSTSKKFLVIETGAYKKGEISTVAEIIQPQYSILTGLNQQHVALFGSIENTRSAKFELAEGTLKTVFFNGDNSYLNEIFKDQKIKATNVPISFKAAQEVTAFAHKTEFKAYGENFTLPWPGEFFVHNGLLALELCREIGLPPATLAKHLSSLAPLKRALSLTEHPQGFTVLRDTYSANPDGVLSAIAHLENFTGKRIFVSIPLRELGGHAETIHQQIFETLRDLKVEVYWEKSDFADVGKKILGKKFHLMDDNFEGFKKLINTLKKDDVVLLESKLSSKILNLFK